MMKFITSVLVTLMAFESFSQINAITETGDEIVLFENGTWTYKDSLTTERKSIPVNETAFLKDDKSTFLVKSNNISVGLHIDPKSWSFRKGTENDAFEYQFQKKGGDLYAMMITEKLNIPVENLQQIAINNARAAAPDIKVIREEYRNVNGIQVLMMQMSGTIQGMTFTYYGYYYSNEGGAVQLLTYTGANLFDDYLADIESFLNGFVVL